MKRGKIGIARRESRLGYLFMAPWILGFLIFMLFPFIATVYLSFSDVRATIAGYEISFTGLNNFNTIFFRNAELVPALMDFLGAIIPNTFVVLVVAFIIAYLLGKIEKGRSLFRTIFFLPVIIMSGPVMQQILSSDAVIEGMEQAPDVAYLFIFQVLFSYSPPLARALIGVFESLSSILWFTGIPIVLFINALQKVNPSMYEAARIDAANEWQILWKITLPQLREVAMVCAVFTLTQLGTDESNAVYSLIKTATGNLANGLGIAAGYAWVYSLVVMSLIGLVYLILRKSGEKEAL